jgi:hypothetical protein
MSQITTDDWTVIDHENDNERTFDSRGAAEDAMEAVEDLGGDPELFPPGVGVGDKQEPPETEVVEDVEPEPDPEPNVYPHGEDLPERSVTDDPLTWMPGHFIDEIDGTPAINRKGFEVLAHHYDISTTADLEVPPEDTGHEYVRVKARAKTDDGRVAEAYGSAHVDRGDDPELLLEMADTRARKRALSIATGVGVVAVAEMKNEVER